MEDSHSPLQQQQPPLSSVTGSITDDKSAAAEDLSPSQQPPPITTTTTTTSAKQTSAPQATTTKATAPQVSLLQQQQQQQQGVGGGGSGGSSNNRRLMNKFPTLHNDNQLGRDLFVNNNFDRNLTVEKARFDAPQTLITPSDEVPPQLSNYPPDESLLSSSAEGRYPTVFSSSTSTNGGGSGSPMMPSSSLSPYSTLTDRGYETERGSRRTTNKKRKRPSIPMNGTASPAEVFHRNLIDAVSNVEDSDENERYVYHTSHGYNSDLNHHPYSHRVYRLPKAQDLENSRRWLSDWFRPVAAAVNGPSHKQSRDEDVSSNYRPKLRYVMDYPHRSKKEYYDNYPDKLRHSSNRRNRPMQYYGDGGGGYTSDDEEAAAPLLSRTMAGRQQKSPDSASCGRVCFNITLGLFAALICIFLLTLYRATPLTDMSVELGRVLASDKELIFDLHVHANNWNWWTVHIADADIGVFAFSQIVPLSAPLSSNITTAADPVPEYLGNFYHFDEPLSFPSTFIIDKPAKAISQIRIKNPGGDRTGSERWSRMIRYPYGLVTRGVLKYDPISFVAIYPQSAVICNVVRVDPTTGTVSEDPDQGYCLKESKHQIHRL
ncbi:hypothetical protein BDB00DRAFT_853817 [Zychaea mexicana]|uniref:uncharacterized protein n=1 Tax=Zychaea mexicana TaxID=64656 RepID=UPI0022FE4F73|nr:uncharacterized protein BDB00DRAFT_853817 [Zychaea mexicana]KAI9484726.1 hypothetical protein BDB00DRAFT_853817 [Zychaea mexicana]